MNAILRRVDKEGKELLQTKTSVNDNIAFWLQEEWKKSWGVEELNSIANAAMTESPVYISVRHALGSSPEERLKQIKRVQESFESYKVEDSIPLPKTQILPQGNICIQKQCFPGPISQWPLYNEGEWWVQDASATLPAIALYNALVDMGEGSQHVVDLCAAPGGKTCQLISLGFPKVTAVEVDRRRAKQLQTNLERMRFNDRCEVIIADGTTWVPPGGRESAMGVLLDVPCSATGTGSRRPDVLRRSDDLTSLLMMQVELATNCADNILAEGGIMVYSTCSLLKQESEDQIHRLLHREEGARLTIVPFVQGEIPGFDECIDENGCLRIIPGLLPGNLNTCDGFFVARLQKRMQKS